MKKLSLLPSAAFAATLILALAGCVMNEVAEPESGAGNSIGLDVTTTRASVAVKSDLEDGFKVYATGGDTPSGWYTDGTHTINGLKHAYGGGQWNFTPPIPWPADGVQFPMNFYAWYPFTPAGLSAISDTHPNLTAIYTVPTDPAAQEDLLWAHAVTAAAPPSSRLAIPFKHMLSKVDVVFTIDRGIRCSVAQVRIVGVGDRRPVNLKTGEWGLPVESSFSPAGANYDYLALSSPDWTATSNANEVTFGGPEEAADGHLMLMPQTAATWTPVRGDDYGGGRIEVLYRMSVTLQPGEDLIPEVGYDAAAAMEEHGHVGALYVLAGFPLPTNTTPPAAGFVWEPGKGYTYNILLGAPGSCNGYLLDEYYYTADGVRTSIRVRDLREVGEKLNDGEIHIKLDVGDWDDDPQGAGSSAAVTLLPGDALLSYDSTTPENIQRFSVYTINASGGPAMSAQWTLESDASWLRFTLDPENPAGATPTLTGTGWQNVYLVADKNRGEGPLHYSGGPRVATVSITPPAGGSVVSSITLGGSVVTTATSVRVFQEAWGGYDDILYFDAQDRLHIGKYLNSDGTPGPVTLENLAFFKFGSVVGFTNQTDGTANWDASKNLKFNPSDVNLSGTASYGAIPSYDSNDWNNDVVSVSDATYHNLANLRAGKGDPCMLLGKTAAEIRELLQNGEMYDSGWRLPTHRENANFIGGPTDINSGGWIDVNAVYRDGDPYDYSHDNSLHFPVVTSYRPAFSMVIPSAGYRSTEGVVMSTQDYYWSSTARDNISSYFISNDRTSDPGRLFFDGWNTYSFGSALRCVRSGDELDSADPRTQPEIPDLPPDDPVTPDPRGGGNFVLYFDESDGNMKVGRWGSLLSGDGSIMDGGGAPIKAVDDIYDLALFKFGSVIGIANKGWGGTFDIDDVMFNPTNISTFTTYGEIGRYTNDDYTSGGIRNVSGFDYHNGANIASGKGDPCMLAGADLARKNEPGYLAGYFSGWRLPTAQENLYFVGNILEYNEDGWDQTFLASENLYWDASVTPPLAWFPVSESGINTAGMPLPAAGYRMGGVGFAYDQGVFGTYWSSVPQMEGNGYLMIFGGSDLYPARGWSYDQGNAVRCVPDDRKPEPPSPPAGFELVYDAFGLIPVDGGRTPDISLDVVNPTPGATWTAAITLSGTSEDGRSPENHEVVLVDAETGEVLDPNLPHSTDTSFRLRFSKVYYPNREIPISATLTVTLGDETRSIIVEQETLEPRNVVAYNMNGANNNGSKANIGGINSMGSDANSAYITTLRSISGYSCSTENENNENINNYLSPIPGGTTYLHVVANGANAGAWNWNPVINWQEAEGMLVISVQNTDGVGRANDFLRAVYATDYFRQNNPGDNNDGTINTGIAGTNKVYDYLTRGVSPAPGAFVGGRDGSLIPIAYAPALPDSAVPVLLTGDQYNRSTTLVVDVEKNFMFIGECSYFNTGLSAAQQQFLDRLILMVENTARYGTHFTDLLLERNVDGRAAQPAPWDNVWGDNADE